MKRCGRCILSTIQSDSHTWNLIYMQLFLEECGYEVLNLGSCTPTLAISKAILRDRPDLIVVSTVNGHGGAQGHQLLEELRENVGDRLPPVVMGGRLTTSEAGDTVASEELARSGFDAVFIGADAVERFRSYLQADSTIERSVA